MGTRGVGIHFKTPQYPFDELLFLVQLQWVLFDLMFEAILINILTDQYPGH